MGIEAYVYLLIHIYIYMYDSLFVVVTRVQACARNMNHEQKMQIFDDIGRRLSVYDYVSTIGLRASLVVSQLGKV